MILIDWGIETCGIMRWGFFISLTINIFFFIIAVKLIKG